MKVMNCLKLSWTVMAGIVFATVLTAEACVPPCDNDGNGDGSSGGPGGGGGGGGGGGNGSNDPAFVMKDPASNLALKQQQGLASQNNQSLKKPADLIAEDQVRYQAYLDAVKKNPEDTFAETLAIWKANDSIDLQRLVIFNALQSVKGHEETDVLQFMLKALDAPDEQRKECVRLGRGNSIEKSIAVKRVALLEQNPRLQTQVN